MTNRTFERILAFALILLVLSASAVYAQDPTPSPRDALINEIKAYADRHVKNDSPMQTQLVVDLYWDNTVGLTPQEIAHIYEEEYARLKEASKPSQWEQLRKQLAPLGWVTVLIILLWNVLKGWITKSIENLGSWAYNRLAGSRLVRGVALRHYGQTLIDKYQKLHIPRSGLVGRWTCARYTSHSR